MSLDPTGDFVARARVAAAEGSWLESLDLACQALAIDPSRTEAAVLVGQARQHLGAVSSAGAELRQLSVLSVDMVASTAATARIGPELMRELMLALYELCAEVVARFGGRITKYSGDGVMAHFGHPIAHEDDARRAVLTGLVMIETIAERGPWFNSRFGESVQVRVGIDSGLTAVGPLVANPFSPAEIAGDPPNIAARLQNEAAPMTVVVSGATHDVVSGWFRTEVLRVAELRNYPRPVTIHRVLGVGEAETRLDARRDRPALVNRTDEMATLRANWNAVASGEGTRLVTISGEGGAGKSRLAEQMLATAIASGAEHLTFACSAVYRGSSLRPVARALRRYFRIYPEDGGDPSLWLEAIRSRLELLPARTVPTDRAVPLIARLLGVETELQLEPGQVRALGFEVLLDLIPAIAAASLLVLWIDDAHNADPSTLELIAALRQRQDLRALMIITTRPEHPPLPAPDAELQLGPLPPVHAGQLVLAVAPELGREDVERIVVQSDGIPFYTEELARAAAGADGAGPSGDTVQLSTFLTARLDELDLTLKAILRPIAVAGRELPVELVSALTELDLGAVEQRVEELERRRFVVRRDAPSGEAVGFRHTLLARAAYDGILEARRAEVHHRLAELMLSGVYGAFPPEDAADNLERAGRPGDAASHWLAAADRAAAAGATTEALAFYDRALAALAGLGDAGAGLELAVQLGKGTVLTGVEGYTAPSARATFERAIALAEHLEDSAALMPAIWGMWAYWFVLGEHHQAAPLGDRCRRISQERPDDRPTTMLALSITGFHAFFMGDLPRAERELEAVWRMSQDAPHPVFPHDPVSIALASHSVVAWIGGDPERSRELARMATERMDAMEPGARMTHLTRSFGGSYLAWRDELDGRFEDAIAHAEAAAAVATEHGYPTWVGFSLLQRSIALCSAGQLEEGLPALSALFAAWRAAGQDASGVQLHPVLLAPYLGARLAEAQLAAGTPDAAMATVDMILAEIDQSGENMWISALLGLRARILTARAETGAADVAEIVRRAREIAERDGATALLERLA